MMSELSDKELLERLLKILNQYRLLRNGMQPWQIERALREDMADPKMVAPVDMLLFCPICDWQHVDAPDEQTPGWDNPPHKSHLCRMCGHIWRPSDRPTNGILMITTKGEKDGPADPVIAKTMPSEKHKEFHEIYTRNLSECFNPKGLSRSNGHTLRRTDGHCGNCYHAALAEVHRLPIPLT